MYASSKNIDKVVLKHNLSMPFHRSWVVADNRSKVKHEGEKKFVRFISEARFVRLSLQVLKVFQNNKLI